MQRHGSQKAAADQSGKCWIRLPTRERRPVTTRPLPEVLKWRCADSFECRCYSQPILSLQGDGQSEHYYSIERSESNQSRQTSSSQKRGRLFERKPKCPPKRGEISERFSFSINAGC